MARVGIFERIGCQLVSKKCIKNKRLGPDSDSLGTHQVRLCMQKTVSKFGKVDAFQLLSKLAVLPVNAPYSALLSAVLFFYLF